MGVAAVDDHGGRAPRGTSEVTRSIPVNQSDAMVAPDLGLDHQNPPFGGIEQVAFEAAAVPEEEEFRPAPAIVCVLQHFRDDRILE